MDLHDLIEQHSSPDPDETADAVFSALGCPTKWRDVFYAVVRDECRRCYRGHVRSVEQSGDNEAMLGPQPRPVAPAVSGRSALLTAGFYNGTKTVTWGEATVEDHQARIAYLEQFRSGLAATIARHQDAIDRLQAAKVACLLELEADAA